MKAIDTIPGNFFFLVSCRISLIILFTFLEVNWVCFLPQVSLPYLRLFSIRYLLEKNKQRQLLIILVRFYSFLIPYTVLAGYCFLCACLNLLDIRWAASEIQMLIGVMISITAFACICINKDAYFGFNDKHPIRFIVLIYLLSIVTTVCVFCFIYKGEPLISNGQVSIFVINLVAPICCALVGTIALVRYFRSMKNGDLE